MKITIVGTGYVGLVSGACLSDFGHQVVCVDKNLERIQDLKKGIIPIYEPGLDILVKKNVKSRRLTFTDNIDDSLRSSEVVFIAVGTPSRRGEGGADLSYVHEAAQEIAKMSDNYILFVTKSTVPVGSNRDLIKVIEKANPELKFDVASNPEFLREGSAIDDFMRPDRVVVGVESERAKELMLEVYKPLYLRDFPIMFTSLESAETIKYASNAFLATKITFINEIAQLCENSGADIKEVSKGMGLDERIGNKFLHAGPGYGGSCFPKDVKAFISTAEKNNVNLSIISAVDKFNDERVERITSKIIAKSNLQKEDTVSLLGLSFKPNTDDIRDSTSLKIAKLLINKGIRIKSYDPVSMEIAKSENTELILCNNAYEACEDAKAIIIGTEWNEFRALDFLKIKKHATNLVIFDLRNIYKAKDLKDLGFEYFGTGK
mgnify:CR=1 FL=1